MTTAAERPDSSSSIPSNPDWDVIVVGAGAAGLMAAYRAASRGLRTLLLEKNRKIGVKILISGGTRCNVTHATDAAGIVAAYGRRQGRFLHSPLAALPPEHLVELLHSQGVATQVEPTGKVFPASNRAIDVRDALVRLLHQTPCRVATETPVERVERASGGFHVVAGGRSYHAANLIITTGGRSFPGCGTTGDGYAWAAALGHTIVEPVPALAPVVLGDQWPRDLSGVTIDDVELTVARGAGRPLERSRASFLFTHFGLSGPAPMNVSRAFSRHRPSELTLAADFWPHENGERLRERVLAEIAAAGAKSVGAVLRPELPRRLTDHLLTAAGVDPRQRCSEIAHKKLRAAIARLKRCELSVQGTRGFAKAEVTAGGVDLSEVDGSTMQSKRQPGLYFAGEILDLDGPIGGYNFQAAFSTGALAGQRVGRP